MAEPLTVERAKELLAEVGLGLAITDGDVDTVAMLCVIISRMHNNIEKLESMVVMLRDELWEIAEDSKCDHMGEFDEMCRKCRLEKLLEGKDEAGI